MRTLANVDSAVAPGAKDVSRVTTSSTWLARDHRLATILTMRISVIVFSAAHAYGIELYCHFPLFVLQTLSHSEWSMGLPIEKFAVKLATQERNIAHREET